MKHSLHTWAEPKRGRAGFFDGRMERTPSTGRDRSGYTYYQKRATAVPATLGQSAIDEEAAGRLYIGRLSPAPIAPASPRVPPRGRQSGRSGSWTWIDGGGRGWKSDPGLRGFHGHMDRGRRTQLLEAASVLVPRLPPLDGGYCGGGLLRTLGGRMPGPPRDHRRPSIRPSCADWAGRSQWGLGGHWHYAAAGMPLDHPDSRADLGAGGPTAPISAVGGIAHLSRFIAAYAPGGEDTWEKLFAAAVRASRHPWCGLLIAQNMAVHFDSAASGRSWIATPGSLPQRHRSRRGARVGWPFLDGPVIGTKTCRTRQGSTSNNLRKPSPADDVLERPATSRGASRSEGERINQLVDRYVG